MERSQSGILIFGAKICAGTQKKPRSIKSGSQKKTPKIDRNKARACTYMRYFDEKGPCFLWRSGTGGESEKRAEIQNQVRRSKAATKTGYPSKNLLGIFNFCSCSGPKKRGRKLGEDERLTNIWV